MFCTEPNPGPLIVMKYQTFLKLYNNPISHGEGLIYDGDNNGQATHGARKHAWRTQAAWANFNITEG